MRLIAATALMCVFLSQYGNAQNVLMINNGNRAVAGSGQPRTVTINLQLTLPAAEAATSADMTRALAATSQSLYDVINHECDVLAVALKGDCRLIRLNVGGNMNDGNANVPMFGGRPNAGPVVNANATATFEIEPKAAEAPAAAAPPATPPAAENPTKK